jgi:cytochrome c2
MKGFLSVFVSVLFAMSMGCAAKSAQKTAADMPDPHAGIFSQKCAKCHEIKRVEEAHATKSKVEMVEILKRMQSKPDSGITDSQLQMMIEQY